MAKKSTPATAPSMPDDSRWRAESDHRTLTDACQILADTARMKGVKAEQARKQKDMGALGQMLTHGRLSGALKRGAR